LRRARRQARRRQGAIDLGMGSRNQNRLAATQGAGQPGFGELAGRALENRCASASTAAAVPDAPQDSRPVARQRRSSAAG
jgi:hypothetical protein